MLTEPAPGVVVSGRYELARVMARGGMGSVWVGKHLQLDVPVAVKFMDPQLARDPVACERFEREAKAAAQLRSPHVVQVLDYGVDGEHPFIVMEMLQGEDLRSRLRKQGRLSLEAACRLLNQACKALRLAGDAGIVHRDLKPGNLFLARTGDDEVLKILDFGVAKAAGSARVAGDGTKTGVVLGSPHYMSPEQARGGRDIDQRSDLFSMGVILFQALTGEKPFPGEFIVDVVVKICTETPPKPSSLVPELPPSVDRFFERALERDPEMRFQSAREMAASFQAIVAAHLGVAESELSSGSLTLPARVRERVPPLSKGASPDAAAPTLVTGAEGLGEAAARSGAGGGEAGTLTQASQSIDALAPRAVRARWPFAVAALAVAAGGVALWLGLRAGTTAAPAPPSSAGQAAALATSDLAPHASAAASEPSSTVSSSSPIAAAASASATSASVAAPSAPPPPLATHTVRTAPTQPPPPPSSKPPPAASTPTPHPVLGI